MKILSFLLILISGIFLTSCGPKKVCPIEKPIYTNEDEGFSFVTKQLLCKLSEKVPKKWFFSEKKTVYIHWVRNKSTGNILDTTTEKLKGEMTEQFSESKLFSVMVEKVSDKQADYIIQSVLLKSNTDSEQKYLLRVNAMDSKTGLSDVATHAWFSSIDTTPRPQMLADSDRKPARLESEAAGLKENEKVSPEYFKVLEVSQGVSKGYAFYQAGEYEKAMQIFSDTADLAKKKGRQKEDMVEVCEANHLASYELFKKTRDQKYLDSADYCLKEQVFADADSMGEINALIKFKTDTAEFMEEQTSNSVIKSIARYIEEQIPCIKIIGHTSCTGDALYNCQLSRKRAKAVENRIIELYPDAKTDIVSRGRSFFEARDGKHDDNSTSVDRRVEFKITSCETLNTDFPTCEDIYRSIKAGKKEDKCNPPKIK